MQAACAVEPIQGNIRAAEAVFTPPHQAHQPSPYPAGNPIAGSPLPWPAGINVPPQPPAHGVPADYSSPHRPSPGAPGGGGGGGGAGGGGVVAVVATMVTHRSI